MKYFHRTSLPIDQVLAAADEYFGDRFETKSSESRQRVYEGSLGTVSLSVQAEGGHYTLITAKTSDLAESEIDKFTKRFMGTVHTKADTDHELRGAY